MRAIALLALLASFSGARAEEAFVTNQLSDDLTVVDLATSTPVATIPIGGKPAALPSAMTAASPM
jgi:YVTN family beta-propeller protein